jgi:hypothetical protein
MLAARVSSSQIWSRAAIVHRSLRFLGPVTEQTAVEFVAALELAPAARVADAATGDAWWAARVRARWGCAIEEAPSPSAWLAGQHAWRGGLEPFDCVLDLGAPFPDATVYDHLTAAREVLRPGGRLLLGTGYWRLPPAASYLRRTGFAPGSMTGLGSTFALAAECGLRVRHWSASAPDAWEAYESAFRDRLLDWAASHPGHPDAPQARERAASRWQTWLAEGRYVLGFALILAQAE